MKMRSTNLVPLAILAALASAQSPTISAPSSSATDVAGLIAQIPRCAINCVTRASADLNCSPSDFSCLCRNSSRLATSVGGCLLASGDCTAEDLARAAAVAPQICTALAANPSGAASASNLVTSILGSATVRTPTQTPTRTTTAAGNSAGRAEIGAAGIVALAAWLL